MSDTTKPMRVWARPTDVASLADAQADDTGSTVTCQIASDDFFVTDRPHLLLPIEDGALRVGDYLFRGKFWKAEFRTDEDPPGEWHECEPLDVWDLLMDAVKRVEP